MTSRSPLVLDRADQVRAIAGPTAHRILSVMERCRRCTVSELAGSTGLDAGSLYYHVRKLVRAGVLVERERRSTGGRDGVVYELAGSEVRLDPDASGPAFLRELGRSIRSRLRHLERLCLDAVARRGTRGRRGRRPDQPSLHFHDARLSARDRAELRRRIEDLEAFLVERDDPAEDRFTHVVLAVVPVPGRG